MALGIFFWEFKNGRPQLLARLAAMGGVWTSGYIITITRNAYCCKKLVPTGTVVVQGVR